jgi:transcriptional regulator with XRE-family HTH domain
MSSDSVGSRVRRVRETKDVSLEELAERTGLQKDFLASLEEEDVYPSLGPLLKVSRALGVRLGTFMDDKASHDPLIVRLENREIELSMLTGKEAPVSLQFYSLGKAKIDRHMEPFFVELLPESNADGSGLSSHEGEEFMVVVKGEIDVTYGQEKHRLKQGDSVYYNSIVPHHVCSVGDRPAEIYAVLYLPE